MNLYKYDSAIICLEKLNAKGKEKKFQVQVLFRSMIRKRVFIRALIFYIITFSQSTKINYESYLV